jgi:hypothetical protein
MINLAGFRFYPFYWQVYLLVITCPVPLCVGPRLVVQLFSPTIAPLFAGLPVVLTLCTTVYLLASMPPSCPLHRRRYETSRHSTGNLNGQALPFFIRHRRGYGTSRACETTLQVTKHSIYVVDRSLSASAYHTRYEHSVISPTQHNVLFDDSCQ